MPAAKKRKIAPSSEPLKEGLSVTVDESLTKKASTGELAVYVSVPEGNAVQNQERLERFKALQARAVSVGRFDVLLHQQFGNNER